MNQTHLVINPFDVHLLDATNRGRWVLPSLLAHCPLTLTKTLNGLQYHLQMYDDSCFLLHKPDHSFSSTAHFRHALSTKFSSQQLRSENVQGAFSTGYSSDTEAREDAKRIYVCRHPNCFKAYKQPSGLRYHLKHVRFLLQPTSSLHLIWF
jgi:hypothetical protein